MLAENHGQTLVALGIRQILSHVVALERLDVEKPQRSDVSDDGADAELSLLEQVDLIAPDASGRM